MPLRSTPRPPRQFWPDFSHPIFVRAVSPHPLSPLPRSPPSVYNTCVPTHPPTRLCVYVEKLYRALFLTCPRTPPHTHSFHSVSSPQLSPCAYGAVRAARPLGAPVFCSLSASSSPHLPACEAPQRTLPSPPHQIVVATYKLQGSPSASPLAGRTTAPLWYLSRAWCLCHGEEGHSSTPPNSCCTDKL